MRHKVLNGNVIGPVKWDICGTGLRVGRSGVRIKVGVIYLLSSPKRPDRLFDPPSLIWVPGVLCHGLKLTTHRHPVLRLRIS